MYKLLKIVEVTTDELPSTGRQTEMESCDRCGNIKMVQELAPTPDGQLCAQCLSERIYGRLWDDDDEDFVEVDPDCLIDENVVKGTAQP